MQVSKELLYVINQHPWFGEDENSYGTNILYLIKKFNIKTCALIEHIGFFKNFVNYAGFHHQIYVWKMTEFCSDISNLNTTAQYFKSLQTGKRFL